MGRLVAAEIVKIVDEAPGIKSFYLRPLESLRLPQPGQFFQVYVPGHEEIPISCSGVFGRLVRITVAERGPTTRALHRMSEGDRVGLRGPFGRPLALRKGSYILVGGGYGVAPLIFAAHRLREVEADVTLLVGARTRDLLLFVSEAEELGVRVLCATEDGSLGFHGTVVDLLHSILREHKHFTIVACGPEPMLVRVAKLAVSLGVECYVLAESMIKCGMGLCGSCELGRSGLLVCRDGPAFDAETFLRALSTH